MNTNETVRLLRKPFNREERNCSAAPATVRTFARFHCSRGKGTRRAQAQDVVSRETCLSFSIRRISAGLRKGNEKSAFCGLFALPFSFWKGLFLLKILY